GRGAGVGRARGPVPRRSAAGRAGGRGARPRARAGTRNRPAAARQQAAAPHRPRSRGPVCPTLRARGLHRHERGRAGILGRRGVVGCERHRVPDRVGRGRRGGVCRLMTGEPLIQALVRGQASREAVDALLAERSFPLVEGPNVTFVWRGEADAVNLKHWVYGLPSSQPLTRLGATDLWYLTIELPEKSRVEYKLEIVRAQNSEWIEDPLNPNRARDPFGANSVVPSTGYNVPDWVLADPDARTGRIEETVIESTALGARRSVGLYLPARFRATRRYPLLVVHDGRD